MARTKPGVPSPKSGPKLSLIPRKRMQRPAASQEARVLSYQVEGAASPISALRTLLDKSCAVLSSRLQEEEEDAAVLASLQEAAIALLGDAASPVLLTSPMRRSSKYTAKFVKNCAKYTAGHEPTSMKVMPV